LVSKLGRLRQFVSGDHGDRRTASVHGRFALWQFTVKRNADLLEQGTENSPSLQPPWPPEGGPTRPPVSKAPHRESAGVRDCAEGSRTRGPRHWALVVAVAGILIAVGAFVLGAWLDLRGHRQPDETRPKGPTDDD